MEHIMNYTIKDFVKEEEHMYVGFHCIYNDRVFVIDKRIPLVEGKTDEEYTADALIAATPEIDAWKLEGKQKGKGWDPDTNTFIEIDHPAIQP